MRMHPESSPAAIDEIIFKRRSMLNYPLRQVRAVQRPGRSEPMPVNDRSLRLIVLQPEAEAPAGNEIELVGAFDGKDFGRLFQHLQRSSSDSEGFEAALRQAGDRAHRQRGCGQELPPVQQRPEFIKWHLNWSVRQVLNMIQCIADLRFMHEYHATFPYEYGATFFRLKTAAGRHFEHDL